MIWPAQYFRQMEWRSRKTAVSSALKFPFLKEVSQNCVVFDAVNFENWSPFYLGCTLTFSACICGLVLSVCINRRKTRQKQWRSRGRREEEKEPCRRTGEQEAQEGIGKVGGRRGGRRQEGKRAK